MPSIIATPWEAKALAEGRLTAFVRPVKETLPADLWGCTAADGDLGWFSNVITGQRVIHVGPFGRPGDVLAVKETWLQFAPRPEPDSGMPPNAVIDYKVDYRPVDLLPGVDPDGDPYPAPRWRSGATMPAWAVRHHKTVVSVEIKQAWTITEDEAQACGVVFRGGHWDGAVHPTKGTPKALPTAVEALRTFYDAHWSKRGYPWGDNHWVWIARVEVKA